jgi:hypothetical protein
MGEDCAPVNSTVFRQENVRLPVAKMVRGTKNIEGRATVMTAKSNRMAVYLWKSGASTTSMTPWDDRYEKACNRRILSVRV